MKRIAKHFLVLSLLVLVFSASSCSGQETRCDIVTLNDAPLTLLGPELKAGDHAPDFSLLDFRLKEVTLKDFDNKAKVISVVPSIDTPT